MACLMVVAGCSGATSRPDIHSAGIVVGDCATPAAHGVVSGAPRPRRADRDLNGDGVVEEIVSDQRMCSKDGNCHWNVFTRDRARRCTRYLGTIAGREIELAEEAGEGGFRDVRGWWRLAGGKRYLLQHYRLNRGAYTVVEVLLCRRRLDRLVCVEDRK